MSGRIVNKLQPDDEGSLCPTLEAANAQLQAMLNRFKTQGYVVTIEEDDQGPLYCVADQIGKPIGRYYVE